MPTAARAMTTEDRSQHSNHAACPPSYVSIIPIPDCEMSSSPPTRIHYREKYQRTRVELRLALCYIVWCFVIGLGLIFALCEEDRELSKWRQYGIAVHAWQQQVDCVPKVDTGNLQPRGCITGFTVEQLRDGYEYLQEKYGMKAVNDTDNGVKRKMKFVVAQPLE